MLKNKSILHINLQRLITFRSKFQENMLEDHFGEFAALLTAFFWTATGIAFEDASKRIGSVAVNFLRLFIAFILLGILTWIIRGTPFPFDATSHQWSWLLLSGVVGFVLGDLFLFKSYIIIGARVSMLIMALVPPITALTGWIIMNERLTIRDYTGMFLVLTGIVIVILERGAPMENATRKKVKFSFPKIGLLYAFGGAVGQAIGLVLSKYGMQDYDPFAATQIRIIAGGIGFTILVVALKRVKNIGKALKNRKAMISTLIGSFFGPFLGVSFSLWAIQETETGVAATIMSIVPVLIIAPSVIIFKEKLKVKEIIGAIISVAGVAILFL